MSYIKEDLLDHEESCNDPDCAKCCEHSDNDGHCCLICGADVGEKLRDAAEWYYSSLID